MLGRAYRRWWVRVMSADLNAESVSPEWLAERAAIAEKRLKAMPPGDLGPAGRLLMAALIDGRASGGAQESVTVASTG